MKQINEEEYERLLRRERKLDALEAGGVDNWDCIDYALEGYWADEKHNEKVNDLIGELAQAFGECAYEPSERGAGVAFHESMVKDVMEVLNVAGVIFKEG